MSEFSQGSAHEFDSVQSWQLALERNVVRLGNEMGSWGDVLASHVQLRLTTGDDQFQIIPELKKIDDDIEITCNLDSFETWVLTLSEVPGMGRHEIRDLYLSTAAAWVEMTYVAESARIERETGDGTERRSRAMMRSRNLVEKLVSKSDLEANAEELEHVYGIAGATDVVRHDLSPKDIMEINRIRYGLGAAMYALGYTEEQVQHIVQSFRSNLELVLSQYEITLMQLLDSVTHASNYSYLESHQEQLKQFVFPHFLFAGTMPLRYT